MKDQFFYFLFFVLLLLFFLGVFFGRVGGGGVVCMCLCGCLGGAGFLSQTFTGQQKKGEDTSLKNA